ncbi:hypothetical protein AWZ03_010564 [Drosophila navojoa]|uniref:LITAF domain-containing protein n=1 Tax=Drosophila navojoa TaxID=7232 RepID=A0A484B424_DRONA|nr:lipopolysaccharide-induced tumor necrosis factor-alpha factor homolog [Drosophila navojoa]TDG43042.1 hypothetical protein AWZ03_010564 [Drosophila navojoa]
MSTPVGSKPCSLLCPNCHQQVTTRTEAKASNKTHILALILGALCLWPCAACLYCTECARNTEHYCPSCNNYIGSYER